MVSGSDRLKGRTTLKVAGFLDEFEKDEVKSRVDLVDLFASFGVALEKKGKSYMGLCPFHDDRNPSLSVDREKGLFHCFGCGEAGDAFDLVEKMKGVGFPEALAYLKKYGGNGHSTKPLVVQPKEAKLPTATKATGEKTPSRNTPRPALESVTLETTADYYRKKLATSKTARAYLEGRGLWKPEILGRLSVGFSTGDLPGKLTEGQRDDMKSRGLLTERGTEALSGCITVPLYDERETVAGFYGRKIDDAAAVKHLYLKGPHRGLVNRKALAVYREEIILTESVLDALSLMVLGIENVVPCYGTNGFTDEHLKALKDERVKTVTIAFDADEAGRKGYEVVQEKLLTEGFRVKVVFPNSAKDWNEVLCKGLSREEVSLGLKEADVVTGDTRPRLSMDEQPGRYIFTSNLVRYRVAGVKEGFLSSLKVNVKAEMGEEKYIDNVDLYSARSRTLFSLRLAGVFEIEAAAVEKDLLTMVELLEEDRDRKLYGEDEAAVLMSEEDRAAGMALLTDPALFNRIDADLSALGYVGERTNKLLLYLAASSRKMPDPMSVIVVSRSAAGKSYLIDTVKRLIPMEDVLSVTSLSDQALNYLPEEALKHKFLSLGEAVHSDVIDHQMREMLSAHELSRLVTVKDEKSGKMVGTLVRKEVIVSAVMSSTSGDINPENASRCFVVNTDESTEQTKAIHRAQRRKYTLERMDEKELAGEIIRIHHAAQRLLTGRIIVNPFAEVLDFPATMMRSRRDHERFIDLIACVCFLRQFQKEERDGDGRRYIACDIEDYTVAYEIMMKVLPSTLSSLPKSAGELYERIRELITAKADEAGVKREEVSVTQREIREKEGFEHSFVKRTIRLLVEYEYLIQKGGRTKGGRAYYRLNHEGPLSPVDLSEVPTPEEIRKREKSRSQVGQKRKRE